MYIILLCLTYFCISKVNTYDQQVKDLYDAIRSGDSFITFDNMLRFVHSDEPREIRRVLAFHGTQLANGEFIMDFEQFLRAANGGDIPKFRRQVINALYIAIIPDGSDRDYIILDDLVEYYCGERYQKTRTQMETIMNQFAEPIDGEESRLYFPNFRRILNLGFLPAPQR